MAVVSYPHTSTAWRDTGVAGGPGPPYTSATFDAGTDKAIVLSTGVSVPAGEISVTVTLGTLTAQAGIAPRSPTLSSPNLAPLDTGGLAPFTSGGRSYLRLDSSKPTATTSWAHGGGAVLLTLLMTSPSGGSLTFTPITQNLSPELGMICPSTGSAAGGTVVSFAGARLGQITSVTFGGTPGTGLTVTPGIGGTVTSPAHIAGAVDMVAQSATGPSAPVTFTYAAPPVTPPPTITKIIPTAGPDTGGTLVDIVGTDLTGATAVDFGGTAGTGLTVDPSGSLATVTSPAHTAGPAPVTITTPAGTSAAETFTFEAPLPPGGPVVVAVIPAAARPGATIQIVGTNLTDAIVTMCGETVAIVSNDGTIITVVVPPGCPDGDTTITVTTPDGETTADFAVLPVPEPGECPSLTDWCAPDTPCPDCTPCVVAPPRPLIAMWADLAARIRCGWPADRCPPGAVTVEATQQPPSSDCDAEVQVIPGGPAGADHAGVTTWGGRVVVLRPWAQINEAGQLTDAAQAQRLEAIARSLEDLRIMQQLIVAAACGACGPGGATIDRVERVTSTSSLGWAFTVRIS
jgi:hypothetical protein